MSWTRPMADQWGGRHGSVRLVARVLGGIVLSYLLVVQGAFSGPWWVAACTAVALVLAFVTTFLRLLRPFDRLAVLLAVTMMVCGALANPHIAFLGSVFFVIGGILLVGQPELPLRRGLPLVAASSLVLVGSALLVDPRWTILLTNAFGAAGVALLGGTRRQNVLRERQDRALTARSRELEQRNAELEAQTERTRAEAARAAALEERSRIAREIHDLLAHSLGGLVVQLDAAEAELTQRHDPDAATRRLRTSRQLAVDGLREARAAVGELRGDAPATDEELDLVSSVLAVVRGPVGLHLGADLDVVGAARSVPATTALALAAVAREALTNVNKHAPGCPVSASLVFEDASVRLEVVNGRPVESTPARADLAATGAGAGLQGLAQRLATVGGRLTAGTEGRRWVLTAVVPIPTGAGPRPAGPEPEGTAP